MSSWQTLDLIARTDHARRARRGEVAYAAAGWKTDRPGTQPPASIARAWKRLVSIARIPWITKAPWVPETGTCSLDCCPGVPSPR